VAPGSDPATVRSAVLAVVAAEGLPLASIRAVLPSLEDVYRRAVARPAASGSARPRTDAADDPVRVGEAEPDSEPAPVTAPVRVAMTDPVEPVTLPSERTPTEDER
jgi:hypothetical protein